MFYCIDTHLVENKDCLLAEDLDDADVIFGVEVGREESLSEYLVKQFGLLLITGQSRRCIVLRDSS